MNFRSKTTTQHAERKPEKKMRQHQSTLRLFSQVEIPSELLRDLLRAAEYGDIPTVQEILAAHPNLDTNAPDPFGRTALQIAVSNEHAEIVEHLLERSSPANIYLALLLAINHNYENVTEMILACPIYRQYHNRWQELAAQLPDTSPFSDDISPIILACQKNLFGIVHLLLQDGMRVPVPHHFDCSCVRCQQARVEDQLKHAKRRLNEYRALTSEAYISLTSPDPFQTAFELCREMELRATWEKHFKREYKTLITQMRRYVVKLLDCIRTHDELQTILNWPGGVSSTLLSTQSDDTVVKKRQAKTSPPSMDQLSPQPLARLRVAIHYHQKEFVSHWACQQELMRKWLRGFSQYHGSSSPSKIFTNLLLTCLGYPILMVFHWVAPESKLGRIVSKPMVKFVAYSMSYLFFLGILFIITITPTGFYAQPQRLSEIHHPAEAYQPLFDLIATLKGFQSSSAALTSSQDNNNGDGEVASNGKQETLYHSIRDFCNESLRANPDIDDNAPVVDSIGHFSPTGIAQICRLDKDFIVRPHADNWVCWIVTVWLFGLFCRKVRRFVRGTIGHIGTGRCPIIPAVVRSPFDVIDYTQLAFFAAALASRVYAYYRVTESVVFFLSMRPSASTLSVFPSFLYWLSSDRVYFHPGDPLTVSELMFAVGGVFSFARLLYIFPALEVFGPCYLALMRVVKDIIAFSFIFLVVFAAFMIGTLNTYWYFNPELRRMLQLNESYQPDIPAQVRFGNIELTFRTVFWSLFGLGESDYMSLNNFGNGSMIWVERIGYIMYGAYNIVVVCVLLNMLIAMMAKSYEVIKQNAEMEWKFARTILFLEYIPDNTPAIPTPFNLFPNPRYLWEMVGHLIEAIRPQRRRRHNQSVVSFCAAGGEDTLIAGRLSQRSLSTDSAPPATGDPQSRSTSVTAPVQIRIDTGDDTLMDDFVEDHDDAFTSLEFGPSSPKSATSPKNVQKTLLSGSSSSSSTARLPGRSYSTSAGMPPPKLRIDDATMTGDVDDDYVDSGCCNFCRCCYSADTPRVRTRLSRTQTVPPQRNTTSPPTSEARRKYATTLHLSVPANNNVPPQISGDNVRRRTVPQNKDLVKFRSVVFNILRRYILGLSTANAETTVDLEEIKQDISSFRFEVLNLLTACPEDEHRGGLVQNNQMPVQTMHQATSSSSLTRRRLSRHANNSSPASIRSVPNDPVIDMAPRGGNNNSASNLLMVSPSQRMMTPTSELSEQPSSSSLLDNVSPMSSVSKASRLARSYAPAPYRRRHSLLPSSSIVVGSLIPAVAGSTAPTASAEDDQPDETASNSSKSEGDGSPPVVLRRSPSNRGVLLAQRTFSNDTVQAYLEEVDEELEEDEM